MWIDLCVNQQYDRRVEKATRVEKVEKFDGKIRPKKTPQPPRIRTGTA
jgi:hypothetical protein